MSKRTATKWLLYFIAAVLVLLGGWWLLSAMITADLRFGHCGPSSLEHADTYCQVATRLLYRAYAALGLAVVSLFAGLYAGHRRGHAA
jgi:hypothetical protein